MSTSKTVNYNLHSWAATDYVRRIEFNENFDIIDTTMKNLDTAVLGKAPTVHVHANATQTVGGFQSPADKTKLDGIATSANNYVHPATHAPSIIVQDINNRFVTDTEKTYWNNKASTAVATNTVNGLLAFADKVKLDTVATNANNYTHPATHPPSIIAQDLSNRFVTDAEKSNWNGKAPTTVVTTTVNGLMDYADKVKLNAIENGANNYVHPATHPASVIVQDSSNRFMTDAERTKLSGIATSANNYVHPSTHPASIIVQDASNRFMTDTERTKLSGIETNANNYVLPSSLPPTIIAQDATNRFITDAERSAWNNKPGGTLASSTNDGLMASTDKVKLDGVATNANNYVHPSTHPASIIVQDTSNRFTSDTEKAAWNAKASTAVVTTTVDGLMDSADKVKLNGIATSANNYVHPANHPASIITQDASNRFTTDTEKAAWNAKASTAVATTTVDGLMAAADKTKMDGISTGANKTVNHASNGSISVDGVEQVVYSHPTGSGNNHIPTAGATGQVLRYSASGTAVWGSVNGSEVVEDASHRLITDTERTNWNAKASTAVATASVNGLMPSTDKAKLDGFTVVSAPTANSVLKLDANSKLPASITGNADGNAATATKLATTRAISVSGDATGTINFDGTANVAIPVVLKNSGVVAGTHGKVTVDSKGIVTAGSALLATDIPSLDYSKITTGKPTTLAGYGITDSSPTSKVAATLPATAGWYRVATSALGIARNAGRFELDWTVSGAHGQVNLTTAIMYSTDPTLNQTMYSTFSPGSGLTKARIVYHTTYSGNYAYLEVYNGTAAAIVLNAQLASAIGWSLITPTAGSIPAGYSSSEITFIDGIVTDTQLSSQVATGKAPLNVNSTTMVPNLNADMIDGIHVSGLVQTSRNVVAGLGLTGGGALSADRTLTVAFGGTGAANTVSRSDHSHTIAGNEVTDVVISAPANDEVLAYDSATAKWINQTLAEAGIQPAGSYLGSTANAVSATKLLTARSISLTGGATGSATFDGSANSSIAVTVLGGTSHLHALTNLSDVSVVTPAAGHTLRYSGTSWANAFPTMNDNSDITLTTPASGHILQHDGTKWVNRTLATAGIQPAGSYLTTTGKAADANLLDGLDSTAFLRSNAADTGTQLTLSTKLITNTISGLTDPFVVNIGTASVDSNGTSARWRNTSSVYISQDSTGDVNFMGTDGGAFTTKFRFLADTVSPYHRTISMGNCRIKALNGTVDQLQIRDSADAAYIPIVASAFTVSSRRETKKNIVPYEGDALKLIESAKPSNYHLKSELDTDKLHLGLILDEAPDEIIDPSETGIDSYAMETLSWKAIQQLSAKVTQLEEKIKSLES